MISQIQATALFFTLFILLIDPTKALPQTIPQSRPAAVVDRGDASTNRFVRWAKASPFYVCGIACLLLTILWFAVRHYRKKDKLQNKEVVAERGPSAEEKAADDARDMRSNFMATVFQMFSSRNPLAGRAVPGAR